MIKKTMTFENYLGEKETATFHFNMSKGELVKMQMAAIDQKTESFQDKLEKIGKDLNGRALIEVIEEIITDGYGEKSTDGKLFLKERDGVKLVENFKASGAYSDLIVELCTDAKACSAFVNGLVPNDLRDAVAKDVASTKTAREQSEARMQGFRKREEPTVTKEPELPTPEPVVIEETAEPALEAASVEADIDSMSAEELRAMLKGGQ